MSKATIQTSDGTWIASNEPSNSRGRTGQFVVRNDGTITNYGLIYVKNAPPKGADVISATLHLTGKGTWASSQIRVRPFSTHWTESQVNWNNQPGVLATFSPTITAANVDGQDWPFDIGTLSQAICDGTGNFGYRIAHAATEAPIAKFYGPDSGFPPWVEYRYSDAPDAPHTLSPSGGRSVSVAKPWLRFDYSDPGGDSALTAVQVQLAPASTPFSSATGFGSPGFDTGTVGATLPELDLSTTAYGGLAVGDIRWWTVRVQNDVGRWSQWADPAQFTRGAKGTLTLSNPPVSGATVTDVTPVILWSLAGATQKRWWIQVAEADHPQRIIYDTGIRGGTDTSFTLPKGVIDDQTTTYRLWMKVQDTVDRENTPGDPIWYQVIRDFTFAESGTVSPVTSLAALQVQSGRPWVQLTWSRSTAPDQFIITRGGRTLDRVDAGDALVSGTSYAYTDRGAAPYIEHTWNVRAVQNGVASNGVTASLIYDLSQPSPAIWIQDPDTDRNVPIIVTDDASFDMSEQAGVYQPVGAEVPVRIVQSQQGLHGTVSGRIEDGFGETADYWISNLLVFKKQPSNVLRLFVGADTKRVVIGNVQILPQRNPNGPGGRAVSFEFWSQDGPFT